VRIEGNRVLGATMRAEDVLLAPSLS